MHPDFNRLRVFYYIFLHNSVAEASKELNITQSGVSQHLQKLETEMKTLLFTRLHKRLVPTVPGQKLFDIIKPFVHDLEAGIANIQRESKELYGTLRIGAPVEFGERYLPGIFALFRNEYPDVHFYLELGHPSVNVPRLKDGSLDFVVADIFSRKGEFSKELAVYNIEKVFDEELIVVCSKTYYEKNIKADRSSKNHLSSRSLLKYHYISYQKHAPALQSWFNHHFHKQSVRLNITLTVESVRGVIAGIKQDMGLGIVPSHLVDNEITHDELKQIKTRKKPLINRISLVQLQDKIPGITEKTFLKFFRYEIEKLFEVSIVS